MRHFSLIGLCALLSAYLLVGAAQMWADDAGLPARPATPAYLNVPPKPPVPNGSFTATVAFPNLKFQGVVAVRAVPGTNRLWALEREGRIWSFEDDPSATTKTLVLDLNDDDLDPNDATPLAGHVTNGVRWWCQGWDDCGLLGLAFHPDFANSASPNRGRFFVCYQARNQVPAIGSAPIYRPDSVSWGNEITGCFNRLARFTLPANAVQADPTSEVILIDQPDRHLWHNGGDLFFGNDGFLYLLNGDEGKADDSLANSQRVGLGLLAGVMRIDVDGPRPGISHAIVTHPRKRNPADPSEPTPFSGNYGIPDDNPWVGLPGVLEEFWAIGLRSPHRMTYDPPTGRIFVGDIGQGAREEVDLIVKGGNYQWAYKEGHKNNRSDCQPPDYTVASASAIGAIDVPLTTTATVSGLGVSPGQIAVGDRIRFTNHAAFYQVTAVSGYPHTSLTLNAPLLSAVPAGTAVRRTTGFSVVAVTSSTVGNQDPNNYGSSQLTISGSGVLPVGAVIAFPGTGGSHQVIASSGTPNTTSITIRPGFSASPAVTAPVAGTALDRLTVFGDEQPPLMDFNRGGTYAFNAIIGGYVYRGAQHPALLGKYLLANNSSGKVYAITTTPTPTIELLFTMPVYDGGSHGYRGLGGFGLNHDGELLLCVMQEQVKPGEVAATNTSTGQLWKIVRSSSTVIGTPIPQELKDTGAFVTDLDGTLTSLTPSASLIPYAVNSPLWSDAAHKARWVAIPDGTTVDFTSTGHWTFPEGTVFVKHFELTVNEQTNTRRRLETRLLVRSPGAGVYGVTYKWNAAGTQATLVAEGGVSESYTITAADGITTRQQTWNYPSRNDCLSCHNANAGYVLGVNTRQLNGNCTYPSTGITDNQLHTWAGIGLFDTPPDSATIATLPSLSHVGDTSATLERRVRSWLDANCSHCHRPGGVHAQFDARYDTPLRQQGLVEGDAMIALGLANARIIARGDISRSAMHLRDNSLDPAIKMPPLAKNLVDQQAMTVMSAWIASLPYNAVIGITNTSYVYDGTAKSVTVSVDPAGLPAPTVTYEKVGSGMPPTTTAPTAIGTYNVVATVTGDLLYAGQASTTMSIISNTAPVITEGTASAVTCDEDNTPTAFALTLHATDVNAGQTLTWSISDAPDHGVVAPLGSGASQIISYLPAADFNGSDQFTVRVSDGFGGSTETVVSVTISPRNDAPVQITAPLATLGTGSATTTTGTWADSRDEVPGTITTAIQWQRADDALGTNLRDIAGATIANHLLVADDTGRFLRARITASDDGEGLPISASSIAYSDFIAVPPPAGPSGSGSSGSGSGGGGGCGLGGGIATLIGFSLLLLRRQRLR